MKSLHLFLVAALSITVLTSCRNPEESHSLSKTETASEPLSSSFDEPGDPPKDKPRDRDNWKPASNHRR